MGGITRFALDSNRLTMVFIAGIVILGVKLFLDFPRQEDPPIVIREVVVTAFFPGMDVDDIEELITSELEAELRTLPELGDIWSDSKHGMAIIQAETRDEFDDLDLIWQRVRNRMIDVKPRLPEGTIGPFVNDEFGLTAVASVALWTDGFSMADMRATARDIRDRLYELPGIRKVELYGINEEQVFLDINSARLASLGIRPAQIINTLVEQNVVLPGGRVDAADQHFIVTPTGNFRSVDDIENVEIDLGAGQSIRLKDVLEVSRDYADPPAEIVYFNGRRAVTIGVSITPGVNAVGFGQLLTAKLEQLEAELPLGYVLEYATFQPDLVEAAVNGGLSNVYQTLVIVLVVVMLFLGLRTGLIVGSFVPLTMMLGLILMRVFDLELERVSIASSIIALGMLVDNGIVIAEEIRSRMERGEDPRQACLETGQNLALPLLTSSLTTIFAFLPMLLMLGQTGDYAFSLPMVVILLLLASWFLSMFVTPSMCFWFMKVDRAGEGGSDGADPEDAYDTGFYRAYRGFVEWMLKLRFVVLVGAILAILGGLLLASQMTREFFGPSDRNQFLIYLDLPAGYRIEATDRAVQHLTRWLADEETNPEVESTVAYVGSGGPRFFLVLDPVQPDPHVSFLVVNTAAPEDTPVVVRRVRQYLTENFPQAMGQVKRMWLGSSEPGLVEVRLIGPDPEVLYVKGRQLVDGLRAMPGIRDALHDWENKVPKARIQVDQQRARRAGVTSRDVARALLAQMDGLQITDYREGDLAIPVVARTLDRGRDGVGDLWNVQVTSSRTGELIPLPQIAEITGEFAFFRINRRNQERTLTVEFTHNELLAPDLLAATLPLIDDLELPPGYRWEPGGEIESSADTLAQLTETMPLAFAGIVILLIWQFNSFRRPMIIFLTIPLAFTGAFIGLQVVGAPLDFFAMLGLLSLAGVIINNGIVLIDRIDGVRSAGGDPYDAIVDAAVTRLRPILMATVTTILGLMPLILSQDALFFSMAINMAFGLAFGTVLTLGLVPVLYSIFFRIRRDS